MRQSLLDFLVPVPNSEVMVEYNVIITNNQFLILLLNIFDIIAKLTQKQPSVSCSPFFQNQLSPWPTSS